MSLCMDDIKVKLKKLYIMCLYTKYLLNKKYLPTKKNEYNPPVCQDQRLRYVPTNIVTGKQIGRAHV